MTTIIAASLTEGNSVLSHLIEKLEKLEDDAFGASGIALVEDRGVRITRTMNALQALNHSNISAKAGLGATEIFNRESIQPFSCFDRLVVAFDGELKNKQALIDLASSKGYGVDDLVNLPGAIISCMLDWYMSSATMNFNLVEALSLVMEDILGSVAIAVIDRQDKNTIVFAQKDSAWYVSESNGAYISTVPEGLPANAEVEKYTGHAIGILHNGQFAVYDYVEDCDLNH
jgi:glucosamine 6-phosphate synthetase-like amidotransferase/phosphosugar isomerase protein